MMEHSELVRRQRAWFESGLTRPLAVRRERLQALRAALDRFEPDLLRALADDLRKSAELAQVTELGWVRSDIDYTLRHLDKWARPRRVPVPWFCWPGRARVIPEPYGVVLILGPWNYPVQLLLSPLVAALAGGNCAVLKPSELAPATARVLAELISRTFALEHVACVQGDRTVAEALLEERFDKIFFTGSAHVGRKILAAAAKHLTPVTLELGGKSPAIVCADAPVEVAARRIAWGKFLNAGQTCLAPDFVWAERGLFERLIEGLRVSLRQFYGPDPKQSPDYGRIIHRGHWERLSGYLTQGCVVHGGQTDPTDLYIAPTLLTDVPLDAPAMQEEIFGPILPVLPFDSLGEVLAELRRRPAPLAVYLFTRDRALQERVLNETRSGGVCFNDTLLQAVPKELPFGGVGESGFGRYHGRAGFDCFTRPRSVLERSLRWDLPFRYPPVRFSGAWLRRALGFLLRV
jgi:aldehyde dehydrogenase (NAD+)